MMDETFDATYNPNWVNEAGQIVKKNSFTINEDFVSKNITTNQSMAKGLYLLKIVKPDNSKEVFKLYK